MAVLDIVPGLMVEVLIDGEVAPELDDPDEVEVKHADEKVAKYQVAHTVSKYIEAITGKNFSIRMSVDPPIVKPKEKPRKRMKVAKIGFLIMVDGQKVWESYCPRPYFKTGATMWEEEVTGLKEGKGRGCTERELIFLKIETTDDVPEVTKIKRFAQRMSRIGVIEVKVYGADFGKQGGDVGTSAKGFVKGGQAFPEKALKGDAKSHGVALGEPEKTKRGDVWRTAKIDGEDYPMAIFRIMYRSKESLKLLHIVPRTPEPTPSRSPSVEVEEAVNEAGLTAAQQKMVADLLKTFQREEAGGARGTKRKATEIKREKMKEFRKEKRSKARRLTKASAEGGEKEIVVIDDSDDDGDEDGLFLGGN